MTLFIPVKDGEKVINVGDITVLTKNGMRALGAKAGTEVKIVEIRRHGSDPMDTEVGVNRTDGEYWPGYDRTKLLIYAGDFLSWFHVKTLPKDLYVSGNFVFRGRNLKGMSCKKLAILRNGDFFVEMEEDIGGCSCDGLGKTGHCIAISRKLVSEKKKPVAKKGGQKGNGK